MINEFEYHDAIYQRDQGIGVPYPEAPPELILKVEQWFLDRDMAKYDGHAQLNKLKEEVDELVDARLFDEKDEEVDAVGDILVVLIGYCLQRNLDLVQCLEVAYDEIKDRKGKVVNGNFVKE